MAEDRIRHLEMIQRVIARMATSSAMVKNLCMIIVAGGLAFAAQTQNPQIPLIVAVLTLIFWFMDAKYLQQEKWFRDMFDREKSKPNSDPVDFVMTPDTKIISSTSIGYGLKSWSTKFLYPPLIAFLALIAIVLWKQPLPATC